MSSSLLPTKYRLNITDDQGNLLGRLTITRDELLAAAKSQAGAFALVDDIADQAGAR